MFCCDGEDRHAGDQDLAMAFDDQTSVPEENNTDRSRLVTSDKFAKMAEMPDRGFSQLATSIQGVEGKYVDKATAIRVANSGLVLLLDSLLDQPLPIPLPEHLLASPPEAPQGAGAEDDASDSDSDAEDDASEAVLRSRMANRSVGHAFTEKAKQMIKDKVRLRNTEVVDTMFNMIDTNSNGRIEKEVTHRA